MIEDIGELEQAVERDMALLRALPHAAPSEACVERTRTAILVEAARVGRRRRRLAALRLWSGVAAALLLACVLAWNGPRGGARTPATDPDALVGQWADAWDESARQLTSLLDGGWIYADFGASDETDFDDYFRSVDQSLDLFEAL
jgi:hypothetical protein